MSTESVARRFNALLPHLTERQRRLWLATEARELGTGGVAKVARTVGVAPSTVRRGLAELDHAEPPPVRVSRKPGGGRKRAETRDPELIHALEALMDPDGGADPTTPLRWTYQSTLVAAVWTARPRDQRSAPGHLDMLVEQRARRPGQPHWAHRNGVPHAAGYVALEPDRTAAGGAAHHPRARTTTHPARGRGADHPGRRSPRRQGCGTRAGSRRPWHGRAGGCRNGHTPYLSWRMELQPAPEDLFPGTGWPGSLLGELIPRMARCGRLCDRIPYVLS